MLTDREYYIDINGNTVEIEQLEWLEDGCDWAGDPCARYDIGNEHTVWLNQDGEEVELD